MGKIEMINLVLAVIFTICYLYQYLNIPIAWFKKEKPHKQTVSHRFAMLVAARNEGAVIANLLDSIRSQDYDPKLIDMYVVADNCTDDTAAIARQHGATVFERFDKNRIGKGYALNYLISSIQNNANIEQYDAFMVFDADNILSTNYVTEMNRTFSDGHQIITSYRNSKNFGDNWISAGYALWFLRESRYLNYPRHLMNTSCAIGGTGFLFSREVLKEIGNWKFFLLTEDIEFTAYSVIRGERIAFCRAAEFYDEQPVTFRQSWIQRLRWAKGFLQVTRYYGKDLVKGIFTGHNRFSCFDIAMSIMPAMVVTSLSFIINIAYAVYGSAKGIDMSGQWASVGFMVLYMYALLFAVGMIATVTEWKHIGCSGLKRILYMFTFPLFMFTYYPIAIQALFCKVQWQHIDHHVTTGASDSFGPAHQF